MSEEKKKKIVIKKKKPTIKIRLKNKEVNKNEENKTENTSENKHQNKKFVNNNNKKRTSDKKQHGRQGRQHPKDDQNKKIVVIKNKKKTTKSGEGLLEKPKENKKVQKVDWKKKKKNYDDAKKQKEKEFEYHRKKKQKKGAAIPEQIEIPETILVKDLAHMMNLKVGDLITKLMDLGYMATINDALDSETAEIVSSEFGCHVVVKSIYDELQELEVEEDQEGDLEVRAPIVTVMGHVDHGKTTLLDYIRKSRVANKESGGITQHIGAYQVAVKTGKITFIDTPGHAAFTQMRERGASSTDIVILVVAADDGVMPQTIEALNHAKAAGVPIVVAINKMDKENANPERPKQQLSEYELLPEEWGGSTQFIPISAITGMGVDKLLEAVLLEAEMKELKANPKHRAKGIILETKVDKSRGSTATLVIKDGTLRKGDFFVAGTGYGRVRAMFDHFGKQINEAPPSTPIEVIGFESLPDAGDVLSVIKNEKLSKEISAKRKEIKRIELAKKVTKKVSLDDLYQKIQEGQKIDFNVIIKADVQGTSEAIKNMILKMSNQIEEVNLKVIHNAVGAITENDILLASTSNAIVVGFNVRPNNEKVNHLAKEKGVEIRRYSIIYEITDDIKSAIEGLLEPEQREEIIGQVEIRDTFKVPKIGVIAGCYVTDGLVKRTASVRVIRDGVVIKDGKISSLKRFKDDAKEVVAGMECGLNIENFNDIKVGDIIESYRETETARTL